MTTSDVVGHVPRTVGVSSVLFSSQAARDTSTDELDLAPTVLEMPQRKGETEAHEDPVGSPLVCSGMEGYASRGPPRTRPFPLRYTIQRSIEGIHPCFVEDVLAEPLVLVDR